MLEKIIDFLRSRRQAYSNVFKPQDEFVKTVLKDLAKFCRADSSCWHEDPRKNDVLTGRREVWIRIMEHTRLNQDDFFEKYKIKVEGN